jgi:hypothetical protein
MKKINSKVLICSVVKNCVGKISPNIKLAIQTGKLFDSYKIIIYENNSNDGTKEVLSQYSYNKNKYKNIYIISETIDYETIKKNSKIWSYKEVTGSDHPCRIEQICNARNKLIDEINKAEYNYYDYVIWIDFDSNGWSLEGIVDSFNKKNYWDIVYANGIEKNKTYYDVYALRGLNTYLGPEIIGEKFWNNIKYVVLNGKQLIPVYSAFGGIGIFKKKIFKKYRYNFIINENVKNFYRKYLNETKLDNNTNEIIKSADNNFPYGTIDEINSNIFWKSNSGYNNIVVCEHVCLNLELYNNGYKIFINPNMIYLR